MSHPPSEHEKNNLPQGDVVHYSNKITTHQVHQIQSPVNINMPMIATIVPSQLQMQYPVVQQPQSIPPPVQGQPLALYAYHQPIILQPSYGYQPTGQFLTVYQAAYDSPPNNPITVVPNIPQSSLYNQTETLAQAPPNPIPPPVIHQNTAPCKKKNRPHALTSIINPKTGENVAETIYQEAETETRSESSYSERLQTSIEFSSDISIEEIAPPEHVPVTPVSPSPVKHKHLKSPSVNPKSPPKNYQLSAQPQYTNAPNNAQTIVTQSRIQPSSSHEHNNTPPSHQHSISTGDQSSISTGDQSYNQYYDSYQHTQHYPQPVAVNPQYKAPLVNIHNQIPPNYPQQVPSNVEYNQNHQWINQQGNYADNHQQHYPQVIHNYQQPTAMNVQPQNYPVSDPVYNRNNQTHGIMANTHEGSSISYQRLPEAYPRHPAPNYQHNLTTYSRESSHARNQQYNLPVQFNLQHPAYRNTQHMVPENGQTANVYHQKPALPNNSDKIASISSQQYVSVTKTQQTIITSSQVVISHANQQIYTANSKQNIPYNYYQGAAASNVSAQQIPSQYRSTGQDQLPQDNRKSISSAQGSVNINQNLPAPNFPPQQVNYQPIPIPVQENQRINQQFSSSIPESNYQASINQRNQYQSTRQHHNETKRRRNEGYSKPTNNSNQRKFSGQICNGEKPPAVMRSTPLTIILKHSVTPEAEPKPVKVPFKPHVTFQENIRPENTHSHVSVSTSHATSRSLHRNMMRMSQYPQIRPHKPSNPQYQSHPRYPHEQSLPSYNLESTPSGNTGTIDKQSSNLNVPITLTKQPVSPSPTTNQDAPRTILGRPEQGSNQQIETIQPSLFPNPTDDSAGRKSLENIITNPPEKLSQNDQQQQSLNLKLRSNSSETSVATSSGTLKIDSVLITQPSEKEKSLPEPVVEKTNERTVNINVLDAPQTSKSSTPSVATNQQEIKQNQPEKKSSSSTLDTAGSVKVIPSSSTFKNNFKEIRKDSDTSVKSKDLSVDSQKPESQSKLSYSSILASGNKSTPTGIIPKTLRPVVDSQSNSYREQQNPYNAEDKLGKKFKSKSKKRNKYRYDNDWYGNDYTPERRQDYIERPMESKQELNERSLSSLSSVSNTSRKSQPVYSNRQEPVVESKQLKLDNKSSSSSSSSPNISRETLPVSSTGLEKQTVELKQVETDKKSSSSSPSTSRKTLPVSSTGLEKQTVELKQVETDKKLSSSSSPSTSRKTLPVSSTRLEKQTVELKQVETDKKLSSSSSPSTSRKTLPVSSTGLEKQTVESKQVESDKKSSANTSKETLPVSSTEPQEQAEESKPSKVNKPSSLSSSSDTPEKTRIVLLNDLQEQSKTSKQSKADKKSSSSSKKNRAGPSSESQEQTGASRQSELDQKLSSSSSNTSKKNQVLSASEIQKQTALSEAEQLALNLEPLSLFKDMEKEEKDPFDDALKIDHVKLNKLKLQLERLGSYSLPSDNIPTQLIPLNEVEGQASEDPENEEIKKILEEFLEDTLDDNKDVIFPEDHQTFQVLVDQNKEIVIDQVYDVSSENGMSKFRAEIGEKSKMSDPQLIKSFFLQKFTFLSPSEIENDDDLPNTPDTIQESAKIVSEVVITPKTTTDKTESADVKYYSEDETIKSKIVLDDPGFKICTSDETEEILQLVCQKNKKNLQQPDDLECNPQVPICIIPECSVEMNTESELEVKKSQVEEPQEETLSSNQLKCSTEINQYDREFLLRLRNSPYSQIRLANLPDIEIVNHKSNYQINYSTPENLRAFPEPSFKSSEYFNYHTRTCSSKTILPSRNNTPENNTRGSKPSEPPMIHFRLSNSEDVALRKIENAWKPSVKKNNSSEAGDREKAELVYKKIRSVLNKLTPEKFTTLVGQIKDLEIENEETLVKIIDLVFNKAIAEPNFAVGYASMCNEISHLKICNSSTNDKKNFKKFLINRCQGEFEKAASDEAVKQQKLEEIKQCTDSEEKKKLQLSLEEYDYQIRKRSVGIVKFIGELFKKEMLTRKIMEWCINQLLNTPDEERLECLCKLLTTIGKLYEEKISLESYIKQLKNLATQNTEYKVSSRIRFMIQDVVELRLNNWIPRRSDSNPTTMDQLQRDVEQEERRNSFYLNTPQEMNRRNDRTPYRQQNDRVTPQSTSRNEDRFTPKETYGRQSDYLTNGRRNSRDSSRPDSERRSPSKSRNGINISIRPPLEDTHVLGNRNAYIWNKTPSIHTPTETYNPYSLLDTPNLAVDRDRDRLSVNTAAGSHSAGPKEYRSNSSWTGRHSYNSTYSQASNSSSLRQESLLIKKTILPIIQNINNLFQPEFKSQSSLPLASSSKSSSNGSNISDKPQQTERAEEVKDYSKVFNDILDCCYNSTDAAFIKDIENVLNELETSAFAQFLQETTLRIFEDSCSKALTRYSLMLSHMIKIKFISFLLFQTEYQKILETVDDMILDIPHCLTHLSQLLLEMLISGLHPFAELKQTLSSLKNEEQRRKILGELLSLLKNSQGSEWLADQWSNSALLWTDFLDLNEEPLDEFINMYKLDCLKDDCNNSKIITSTELSFTEIQNHLVRVLPIDDFDNVISWICVNVGKRSEQPLFVRNLVTSILRVSIEQNEESWKLNEEMFNKLLRYIQHYVDTNFQLELQCLYAIQAYIHELEHPQGVLARIVSILCSESIIAGETFLAWRDSKEETEVQGRGTVMSALRSFFFSFRL